MANRKEDEKNERIIRNLLKLPDNRRCVNCNSLGPQYVCTNFWTFVCTTCSGMHREFTHRVKSVSMAKFTSQEVTALQGGGNARAKEIYFKEWDPQRHSLPDSSNVDRLRDFIKHVYVDRRFTVERSVDKPPRVKTGEAEDSYENRRDTYQGGSRSPPYENTPERRYGDRHSPGGRSDDKDYRNSYDERRSPGFEKRSPARVEIINDWRREDRFENGRKSDDGRISDGSTKLEGRSPDRQGSLDVGSPPVVRPVRDILGDNVSPLRIIEPPKANGGRATDGSVRTQRTASSSSLASSNGNPTEPKNNNLGSLIDFDDVPDPPKAVAVPQTQQTGTVQSFVQPTTSSSADNWACFDSPIEKKVTQAPSNVNSLDSVLSGLSVQAPVSNLTMFPPASAPAESPFGIGALGVGQLNNALFPMSGAPPAASVVSAFPSNGMNPPVTVADGSQRPNMLPQPHSLFPATGIQSTAQPFPQPSSGLPSNQPWGSSNVPDVQGAFSLSTGQTSQVVAKPAVDVTPEVRPSGRRELPADLFAYPSSVQLPGWQTGPPHGFSYNMHYNTAMPMQGFPLSSKSTNPFDLNNEVPSGQAPTFPSMVSLQGALPNMAASPGILRASSLGTPSPTWMPPQSSYLSAMPPSAQSFVSAMPPSAYMVQPIPNNLLPGQGLRREGTAFGSMNPNQQLGGMYSAPATSNSFTTVGGNPFG